MMEDPIVAEVHRIRQDMLSKHGGDLRALVREAESFTIDPLIAAQLFVPDMAGDDWNGSYADPIVEEVHRIRAEILAEFGGDFDALVKEIERRTEKSAAGREVVAMPPRAPAQTPPPKKVG